MASLVKDHHMPTMGSHHEPLTLTAEALARAAFAIRRWRRPHATGTGSLRPVTAIQRSASVRAAQMKSFMEMPPTSWVDQRTVQLA